MGVTIRNTVNYESNDKDGLTAEPTHNGKDILLEIVEDDGSRASIVISSADLRSFTKASCEL